MRFATSYWAGACLLLCCTSAFGLSPTTDKQIDMGAIQAVRDATSRRVVAAGGITTQEEVDQLDALGVDAVVGMAIYTGRLTPRQP